MPILKNIKHELFAQNLALGTMSQREAYIKAGYKDTPSAETNAGRMIRNDQDLQNRVVEIQEKGEIESIAKVSKIIKNLGYILEFDPADMFDDDGNLLPIPDMPKHVRKTIGGFKITTKKMKGKDNSRYEEMEITTTDIKINNRLDSIKYIGSYLGMWIERHRIEDDWTEKQRKSAQEAEDMLMQFYKSEERRMQREKDLKQKKETVANAQ